MTVNKQGILLLVRKQQPHLRRQPVKVYVNDQNIHSLQGGEQDSFFVDTGTTRVTLKAGIFGRRSFKLQVQPNQKHTVTAKINITATEFWLRILSLIIAVGLVLYEIIFPQLFGISSFIILLGVVGLNIVLSLNRLQVKTNATTTSKNHRTLVV